MTLHVVEAGERGRPLVVLLHGFPEFWWSWRHQLRALSEAGYHVVAPDMRGYHLSDKPPAVDDYRVSRLVEDVAGLIAAAGAPTATVVGHDWGGVVAWSLAHHRPEAVHRLAVLNAPHPRRMIEGLRSPAQMLRSWYVFFFQLPELPERWLSRDDFAAVRRLFERDGMPQADALRYVEAARQGDRLRGGVSYYRAFVRRALARRRRRPESRRIEAPTLVIWGEKDRFLGRELADPDPGLVTNARVERLREATHWVQQDAPERVNTLLLDLLGH